jgi:hypothetical protein
MALTLTVLSEQYTICRLAAGAAVPTIDASFVSVTRTPDELSIVCPSDRAPRDCTQRSDGWRCMRFEGPLDLALTGILASVLSPLAASQISVFAIATFDTDYILIPATDLDRAVASLAHAGIACNHR